MTDKIDPRSIPVEHLLKEDNFRLYVRVMVNLFFGIALLVGLVLTTWLVVEYETFNFVIIFALAAGAFLAFQEFRAAIETVISIWKK